MAAYVRKNAVYVLMILPALLAFVTFFAYPVVRTIIMSLTDQSNFNPDTQFIGLQNYVEAVKDPAILSAIGNSMWYAVATVVLQNIIALPVAVILNSKLPFRNGFRSIFFAPAVLSTLVVGYLWGFILSSDNFGLLNRLLAVVGLPEVNWLGDPSTAMWSIILSQVWQWFGWAMVIYLANLQTINPELVEAAKIDGANARQVFFHVTVPGLLPAIQINCVTGLISGLKVFDIVYSLTGGGPGGATDTVLTSMYLSFAQGDFGYASAFGVLFLIVTLIITMILMSAFKKVKERLA